MTTPSGNDLQPPHPVPPSPRRVPMDELAAAKAALLAEATAPSGPSIADQVVAVARQRPYVLLSLAVTFGAFLGFSKGARRIIAVGVAFGLKNLIGRLIASRLR